MKFLKGILQFVIVLITIFIPSTVVVFAQDNTVTQKSEYLQGRVESVIEEGKISINDEEQEYQKLKILITKGSLKGQEIEYDNGVIASLNVIQYKAGDQVVILYSKDGNNQDYFQITDYLRLNPLLILTIVLFVLVLLIGSKKGFYSVVGMGISFLVIFLYILPKIKANADPVLVAIIGSLIMIPSTFYLSHGFNRKTTVAILGTIIALLVTVLLSFYAINFTHLTGLESEEAMFLGSGSYNLKGILLAGIIIGALGVLDDITISQSAIVYELYDLKPELKPYELFSRAMNIGKDHIAAAVNTLVLAYTGASLPLLLLFLTGTDTFGDIVNMEPIATEIVRTLVGSIGLILAVPLTTAIAAIVRDKKFFNKTSPHL